LRGLAAEKGYTVERGIRRNCWRLIDANGEAVIDPRSKSVAFTMIAAFAFLTTAKTIMRPSRPPRSLRQ
jgi:hypothetical protein